MVQNNTDADPDAVRNQSLSILTKWDGYNQTWLDYCNSIRLCIAGEKTLLKEFSHRYTMYELTEEFFRIIVNSKINTKIISVL